MSTVSSTSSSCLCDVVDGVATEGPEAICCAALHFDVDQALQRALVPANGRVGVQAPDMNRTAVATRVVQKPVYQSSFRSMK